jgi:hypothetical protein
MKTPHLPRFVMATATYLVLVLEGCLVYLGSYSLLTATSQPVGELLDIVRSIVAELLLALTAVRGFAASEIVWGTCRYLTGRLPFIGVDCAAFGMTGRAYINPESVLAASLKSVGTTGVWLLFVISGALSLFGAVSMISWILDGMTGRTGAVLVSLLLASLVMVWQGIILYLALRVFSRGGPGCFANRGS